MLVIDRSGGREREVSSLTKFQRNLASRNSDFVGHIVDARLSTNSVRRTACNGGCEESGRRRHGQGEERLPRCCVDHTALCRGCVREKAGGNEREKRKIGSARALGREGERNRGLRTMWNGDDGEKGGGRQCGVGGGGSGDVLAKVTAGNAVYVRRSKVACRVAELSLPLCIFLSPSVCLPSPSFLLTCSHAPFVFLPSQIPRHPLFLFQRLCVVAISLLASLSFSFSLSPVLRRGAVRHGRLQECTKCTVLTDARPCSAASTCLLRPFSFASPRSSSLSPPSCCPGLPLSLFLSFTPFLSFAVLHYFFLRSTTPPPRVTLTSFTSFCRRRRRTATPGNSPLLYQRVMLLPHVLAVGSYVCTSKHTVRRRSTLSLSNIGSYIATRARSHYVRSRALSLLFFSSLPT